MARLAAPISEGGPGYSCVRSEWSCAGAGVRPKVLGDAVEGVTIPDLGEMARALSLLSRESVDTQGFCPVFVDLETTGLSGMGAIPFVIGIATIATDSTIGPASSHAGSRLVVEQWCLERLGEENAMLRAFAERLEQIQPTHLFSFNGASFDIPLLRRRFSFYGIPESAQGEGLAAHHIDLLHPARRLWRDVLENCRLSTLERRYLGIHRVGDLSGAEIPEVFWAWLRAPNCPEAQAQITGVRVHNQIDLVALPALVARLARDILRPPDLRGVLCAARHLTRLGGSQHERAAIALLRRDRSGGLLATELQRCVALFEASLLKRHARHEEAVGLWELLRKSHPGDPEVHEALAKDLEHRRRDPVRALRVARASSAPCAHRVARLEQKVGRIRNAEGGSS